jgi:hypothetical protein
MKAFALTVIWSLIIVMGMIIMLLVRIISSGLTPR